MFVRRLRASSSPAAHLGYPNKFDCSRFGCWIESDKFQVRPLLPRKIAILSDRRSGKKRKLGDLMIVLQVKTDVRTRNATERDPGKCSVKKRRNKAAKKNFQILVTCKIWKFFFAAATILVTLISSWVVGRFDRLGDQS